ncbi:hypothetical protein PIB30_042916 [Stylosanthes scabra]|uniref:Aminotransferase-like plant mobile domain-containing protein n=1 Tax=Stylosanthes scabra TaxID=79078 RepID=A0ABU6VG41_9FABA|nr:hypothetical protein [Stylosanthes scabra]
MVGFLSRVGSPHLQARQRELPRLWEPQKKNCVRQMQVPRMLGLRRGSVVVPLPPVILQYVRHAGFEGLLAMKDFDIDSGLWSAFVERWRPKTHTFHLPFG